ncbi:MAG: hypothetical protein HY200_01870 [Nitrospirae bacterium]|nr:hypothetical protein [Nitrospirota bacterium]
MKVFPILGASIGVLWITGCASMHYDSKMSQTTDYLKSGKVDLALADLESHNPLPDKGLLYYLEKGELQRIKGSLVESRASWLKADYLVRKWEDQVKLDFSKLMGDVGSFLINDTTRRYDGRDYEKVLLNVELALNHLALNHWDDARIEIKKMHEREAIIAEFRAKELENAKEKASNKGIQATSFKELKGYPIETLEAPEVRELKNSYESAFANYLAGFVYESLGEVSLAAPGYRRAAEMRPNIPLIDEGLLGLDERIRSAHPDVTDTLFVIESEFAPAIQSQEFGLFLPIACKNGYCPELVQISWPVIRLQASAALTSSITVDHQSFPVVMMTSVDAMARRALSDEMPVIIARTAIRAIAKTVVQKGIDDKTSDLGLPGLLVSIGAKIGTAVSETADERAWRTLPGYYSIARARLPAGAHHIGIQTSVGEQDLEVRLSGGYAVVSLRTLGGRIHLLNSSDEKAQTDH